LKAEEEHRQRLEAELRQARKLQALGQLAGGVVHDFNNILMIIEGYADMLLAEAPEAGPATDDLRQIQDAARRGSDLTRQLLAFGRQQTLAVHAVDLNAVLSDTSHMLARLIGDGITLELRGAAAACALEADRVQLEQVLINLAVNARDAMSGRGTLSIELDAVTIGNHGAAATPAGDYVRLIVRDTGCGMDEATRARIFEPFFTTKVAGQGSGLGLSTVYGIVRQLGGHIEVASAPGAGTTFTIHLPATAKAVAPWRERPNGRLPRGEAQTMLVVEYDAGVRGVLASVLGRNGYHVLEAAGPAEALAAAGRHQGTIDLVVTDVVMPAMNGPDMVALLLCERPATRVLFMSGYSSDTLSRHGVLQSPSPLLQKPVGAADLLHAVRRTLAAAAKDPVAVRRAG
jgi:nitrogen-specific signal transduction histidine kinase/CheY-like chemotaxis protein